MTEHLDDLYLEAQAETLGIFSADEDHVTQPVTQPVPSPALRAVPVAPVGPAPVPAPAPGPADPSPPAGPVYAPPVYLAPPVSQPAPAALEPAAPTPTSRGPVLAPDDGGSRRGRRRHGTDTSRSGLAAALMSVTTVAAAVAIFVGIGLVLPWVSLGGSDDVATVIDDSPSPQTRIVDGSGSTPADQVTDAMMSTPLPLFDDWSEEQETSVATPSLAFGCDPKDGLAPAVAGTRSFVSEDGQGSTAVTIAVRAYSAGGGAVALDGIRSAALACDAASIASPAMALGVDSSSIDSARTSSYTWRRGDVLVTALVESGGAASSVLPYASALTRLDDVLDKALSAGVCADQTGGADQATRSPYLNRGAFKGLSRVVEATPRHRGRTARQLATAKVVPVPPSPVDVPEVGTLPQRPVPAPTTGPLALPATVPFPEQPVTPTEPQLRAQVDQQIEDPDGPGCGWAFTDQVAPRFDEDAAQRAFDRDFNAARDVLDVRWRSWQHAKAAFYTAWAEYLEQVDGYGTYAAQVAKVRRAWDVIDAARADYYTAYENWQTEVAARDAWFADRAQARADYQEARQACRDAASATPTPTPTASSSPGDVLNPPGASPSADPSLECPPARPAILDEVAPTVGPSPKPAAEAQLP